MEFHLSDSQMLRVNSLAGRFHTGGFTIDAGPVLTTAYSGRSGFDVTPFPIPWVDSSWYFGG